MVIFLQGPGDIHKSFCHVISFIHKSGAIDYIATQSKDLSNFDLFQSQIISNLYIVSMTVNPCMASAIQTNHKPDYSMTFHGFFRMDNLDPNLDVSFTFHFHKIYGIICNIFTEWCFDP